MVAISREIGRWLAGGVLVGLLATLGGPPAAAQPQVGSPDAPPSVEVEATGRGSLYAGDRARSRNEAREAAFRDAVEQASGVFIQAETEVRNFELVSDEVLTRSQGFIRDYEVLEEGPRGDLYVMDIRATVEKAAFIKDVNASLELLYDRVGKPRVVAVIRERNLAGGDEAATGEAISELGVTEKEIRKILIKQGFTFIDARTIRGGDILAAAIQPEGIQRDKALELARTAEAEIVILGRAETTHRGSVGQFESVQADLSLDVVRVDTGQVMASESVMAVAAQLNVRTAGLAALKKSADQITPRMMAQVSYQWVKERNQGARIELVVENVSFGELLSLRRTLSNTVRGVQQVQQRSYSDGVALLEVTSRDSVDRLAESLYTARFDGFRLDVADVTQNRLTVRATHEPQ